ncbi:PHB depolymerase family esterase [Polaromonas sp.]
MLHGCTQNPDDVAAGTRMTLPAGMPVFFVLYADQ